MTINIDALKADMLDYYGSAMVNGFPVAVTDISRIECSTEEELINLAKEAGFSLSKYII